MMLRPARVLWQVPGARAFLWCGLGDVAAVHDAASGDTHLLDALSHEILDILAERPQTAAQAAATLAAHLEQPVTTQLEQRVMDAIAEFDRLGLVFPLEPTA